MGSSASTTGLSIDNTEVPILINGVNSNGTAINIQPLGTSNIHTPLRAYQAAAGSIGLPIILQARNTTAGNTSIYSALSLQNTSTSSSASALGANAGVGIDFVIQNSAGASARTATIQAPRSPPSTMMSACDFSPKRYRPSPPLESWCSLLFWQRSARRSCRTGPAESLT